MFTRGPLLQLIALLFCACEGETTLFGYIDPRVTTYFLISEENGECWIWGHDTSYCSGEGCDEL